MNIGSDLSKGPIVVGTDFSPISRSVVAYAAMLAKAELKPLYVAYVMPIVPEDSVPLLEIQQTELRQHVEEASKALGGSGITAKGVLAMGSAAHELLQIADNLDAACIVVGTEGLQGMDRFLLGSVAEVLIRKSDRPVIVVGPEAARRTAKTLPWKHLVLACDTTRGVTEAARLAGNIAFSHRARLTIFHVRQGGIESPTEDQYASLEKMMQPEAWLTVKPQCLIRAGDPAEEIVRMVDDSQADLLVMSVRKGGELLTHLPAGVVANTLRFARCPAMILRSLHTTPPGGDARLMGHHSPAVS